MAHMIYSIQVQYNGNKANKHNKILQNYTA